MPTLTPKLVSMVRAGYRGRDFRADAVAGLTVAIIALPLSMALAIASGLPPQTGLYAAIFGGFLISALGGSRYQIGGPAGAFITLVYSIVERHGHEGLLIATLMAGVFMVLIGILRLGSYIRLVPHAVVVGFSAGIAVIIFASQIKEILGLPLVKEPSAFLAKLAALAPVLRDFSPATAGVSLATLALILAILKFRRHWPGFLIAVIVVSTLCTLLGLPVETIGTRFGAIPQTVPLPHWPAFDAARLLTLLPDALAIAALGSIESLLSAVVADRMGGGQHRPNSELVAQGIANIGASLFGAMCVTGTLARTAANVRAGARSPVAGMLHAVYLAAFLLVAAPLARHIPLAVLGTMLAVVAWNMVERAAFGQIMQQRNAHTLVLLTTLLVTIFIGLLPAIGAGIALHSILHGVLTPRR